MNSSGAELSYSDARVIGPGNEAVADSLYAFERRKPGGNLAELAIANHVSGMTMLFTSRVARLALDWPPPVDEPAIFHDWWVALVALSAGSIAFDPEPLVSYRRHPGNVLGPREPERRERKKRKWLTKIYLDMCKNEFALRVQIWNQLLHMARAEELPRPAETASTAFSLLRLSRIILRNRGTLGRHAYRMWVGRWMLERSAEPRTQHSLEDICARQLDSASLDELS
jgi:hypothetical protein